MKRIFLNLLLTFWVFAIIQGNAQNVDAFPGAMGGGRYVTGGRGGKVLHVTTLDDTDTKGSLRWALKQTYARIIVFDVAGIIELTKRLEIKYDNVTVLGQTAPGDGICIKNYTTYVGANNVIIRFLRFRLGDEKGTEDDAIWGRNQKDIIIDHCSMSWCSDECASFYNNENFSLQWCILGESLRNSVHEKGKHGYGGIWGGNKASFHHNLLLHHDSRNPRWCGPRFWDKTKYPYPVNLPMEIAEVRNCVFYNWGANSGYAGEGGRYSFVNNYYKPGPATNDNVRKRIFCADAYSGSDNAPKGLLPMLYVSGNYNSAVGKVWDWNGIELKENGQSQFIYTKYDGTAAAAVNTATVLKMKSDVDFNMSDIVDDDAQEAYNKVLGYAGCSMVRDAVDARYADEVKRGVFTYTGSNGSSNGLIDSQVDVGGYPEYKSGTAKKDSDNDGMPDEWETANGLNPNDASDAIKNTLDPKYNNIEVYANELVADIVDCTRNGDYIKKDSDAVSGKKMQVDDVEKTEFYSMNGKLNEVPQRGISVMRQTGKDGSVEVKKILK